MHIELKNGTKKHQEMLKNLEHRHSEEIKRIKCLHETSVKMKQEKWLDEKTRRIKEQTGNTLFVISVELFDLKCSIPSSRAGTRDTETHVTTFS